MKLKENSKLFDGGALIVAGGLLFSGIADNLNSTKSDIQYITGSNILISQAINNCKKNGGTVEIQPGNEALCIINDTNYQLGALLNENFDTNQISPKTYSSHGISAGQNGLFEPNSQVITLTPPAGMTTNNAATNHYENGTLVIQGNSQNREVALNQY